MGVLNFNVIAAIRELASCIESSELSEIKITNLHEHTEPLNRYFGTSDRHTWIMVAVLLKQMGDYEVTLRDLVSFFSLDSSYVLELKADIDQLIEKKLLFAERSRRNRRLFRIGNFGFLAAENVVDAVFKNIPLDECSSIKGLDMFAFCDEVGIQIQNRADDYLTIEDLCELVGDMEAKNPDLTMVKELQRLRFETVYRVLLYEMMNDFISGSSSTTLGMTLKDMFESKKLFVRMMDEFVSGRSALIEKGIVTISKAEFGNDMSIAFTPFALELFAKEELGSLLKSNHLKVLTPHTELKEKQLFFDAKPEKEVSFLKQSLQPERFSVMQSRLSEHGLMQGVAALFYGAPGTGKTETVLQLAKATGRDIYRVDISESKSMWYGESQKKIKEIFDNYRQACKHCAVKPILLFNEADALFSTRKENSHSSVDQTENAIQNILLEEIENLDGILIATTNLATNLDKAFDRRFLFKIEFKKPSLEAKKLIWKSKLEWLTDEQAEQLAGRFDFSGGEIDNVVRKVLINQVLTGEYPSVEQLGEYCESEKMDKKAVQHNRVGF